MLRPLLLMIGAACTPVEKEDTAGTAETAASEVESQSWNNLPATTCLPTSVAPGDGEDGQLVAARLTPPSWPFAVENVRYTLVGSDQEAGCDAALAHEVHFFKAIGTPPPAEPEIYASFTLAAGSNSAENRTITEVFPDPTPLLLTEGQSLYVAVTLADDGTSHSCVAACNNASTDVDGLTEWHAHASEAPYAWRSLWEDARYTIFTMEATGRVAGD